MYNKKKQASPQIIWKIVHGVDSQGVTLSIPMPGHDMIHTAEYQTLKELIQECDVVYLLKDTRVWKYGRDVKQQVDSNLDNKREEKYQ